MLKIFLDDIRQPEDCFKYMYPRIGEAIKIYNYTDWIIVRNYEEFCEVIDKNLNNISHISFDHDLSDEHYDPTMYESIEAYQAVSKNFKEKTGYECAKYMKDTYDQLRLKYPENMYVHSMNPVGTERIINLFKWK